MKKFYSLCFAALCAAAIVSCNKESIVNPSNEEPASSVQAILNPVELTFEANADSKISIDASGKASWEEGDQVKIICFNANDESWTSEPITVVGGKISATVESADTYYAVYPASASIALANKDKEGPDSLTVTIPTEQNGTFKNACYYAAKTTKDAKTFNFKAVSGIIKFQAATDYVKADIATVEKTATLNGLVGDATCTFNEDGTVNVSAPTNVTPMIFIDLDKTGTYYAAVVGNATNELAFRFSKDATTYEPGVYFNNRITYEPAKIKNFGNVTDRIVTDVYVAPTASGIGDGKSAENAAAVADLNEACLGNEDVKYTAVKGLLKYSGSWNCFRRNGLTIHFAEGEYTDAFTVAGNNSAFCLTLEGTSGAVLKGGLAVSATRVKTDDHEATVTTVKNLTFTAATGLTIATGLCNVEGCTFTGCTTRAANLGGSSATDVNLNVNFKNCLFSANTVGSKGAVTVPDGATGGIVGFNNCRFENNVATSGNGSAIYAGTGKTAIFLNKCTFIGNTCTNKSNAFTIGTNSADTRFGMNCCTVNAGNITAYTNGAALTLKGQSVIANSTVWTSGNFGKWGLVALGCATSSGKTNGAAIINSVVRQKETTYPAVYLHTNYYQNLNYCLHSGADLTVGAQHTVTNSAKVTAFNSASAKSKEVDGITAYYYTWNYTNTVSGTTFAKPSKTTVEDAIKAVGESASGEADGLGNLFLTWLNTVDENALTKDLIGTARPEGGICPGSVEQAQ